MKPKRIQPGYIYAPYMPIFTNRGNGEVIDGLIEQYVLYDYDDFRSPIRAKIARRIEQDYPWFVSFVWEANWWDGNECFLHDIIDLERLSDDEVSDGNLEYNFSFLMVDYYPTYDRLEYCHTDGVGKNGDRERKLRDAKIEGHVFLIYLLRLLKEHEDMIKFQLL
jgi:hypothetical protein